MAIRDAVPDRQPGDKSGHAKVKVEIDDTDLPDNGGKEPPAPPDHITGRD